MKIQILGNPDLLTSVYFSRLKNGLHELVINSQERYPHIFNRGSSLLLVTSYPLEQRLPDHVCFEVLGPEQKDGKDLTDDERHDQRAEVCLVAENEEDEALLRGIPFENMCKGQLLVLFAPQEGLDVTETPAAWRLEEPEAEATKA